MFAFHAHVALHQQGQTFGDGQAKSGTAVLARGAGVCLLKALEQPALLFQREAYAGIGDSDVKQQFLRMALLDTNHNVYLAAVGELQRIVGIVDDDLAQTQRVTDQAPGNICRHVEHQFQAFGAGFFGNQGGDVVEYVLQIEFDPLDIEFSGFDLGEIQNIVDQPEQMLTGQLYLADVVPLAQGKLCFQRQMTHADDGVHWRANLMAHVSQEVAFGLCGRLGCVQRNLKVGLQCHALRNILQQPYRANRQVIRVNGPSAEPAKENTAILALEHNLAV